MIDSKTPMLPPDPEDEFSDELFDPDFLGDADSAFVGELDRVLTTEDGEAGQDSQSADIVEASGVLRTRNRKRGAGPCAGRGRWPWPGSAACAETVGSAARSGGTREAASGAGRDPGGHARARLRGRGHFSRHGGRRKDPVSFCHRFETGRKCGPETRCGEGHRTGFGEDPATAPAPTPQRRDRGRGCCRSGWAS